MHYTTMHLTPEELQHLQDSRRHRGFKGRRRSEGRRDASDRRHPAGQRGGRGLAVDPGRAQLHLRRVFG